jgi:GNAT superfamily N-acetyltransferase
MKGVNIIRAQPSNTIDVYDLYKKAFGEGVFAYPQPSQNQIKNYHWLLLEELNAPQNIIFLARKGRAYLGLVHGTIVPKVFGKHQYICFIKMVYVADKRRKLGIGRELVSELKTLCKNMGVSAFEFMCEDNQVDYWAKEQKAQKKYNFMVVEE